MSTRRDPSQNPITWTMGDSLPSRWHDSDFRAQHARWESVARTRVTYVDDEGLEHLKPPLLQYGGTHYRIIQMRCGASGCGIIVGAVWTVPNLWRGEPFTWVECQHVDDPTAVPPTVQVWKAVLDAVTVDMFFRADCIHHGFRAFPAAALARSQAKARQRLEERNKSLTVLGEDAPA